jgi:2-succinyl-6-hydroxy-2,4-cyclohexadiene-1-carboxylate synthase
VEEWGGGPVVVLLHGFAGRGFLWRDLAPLLPGDLRYVAPDLPGHGETPWPRAQTSFEDVAGALAALIAELDAAPVRVLGYSLGGRLALALAANHPERVARLVLESASPGLEEPEERGRRLAADDALADFIGARGLEAFAGRWEALPVFATQAGVAPGRLEVQRRARTSHQPGALAAALRALSPGRQAPLASRLPGVSVPALLIAGELDAKFRTIANGMAGAMPRARARVIPRAGHNTHLEEPREFAATVGPFLAGAESSGGS